MPDWLTIVLFFVIGGVVYLVVSSVGNKIVDKGGDAIENSFKRKKNSADEGKTENLADRFRK